MVVSENIGSVSDGYWSVDTEFKWKISSLCCMGCKSVGDSMKSPIFVTKCINEADVEWNLELFPKGSKKDKEEYMSLFLCPKASSDIDADVTFLILNSKGESAAIGDRQFEHTFKPLTSGRGFVKFVLRSFIQDPANDIFDKDEFTILCRIKIRSNNESLVDAHNLKRILEIEKDDSSFHENIYEALFNDSEYSDVALSAEGKTIKVYKGILAKSSSVFASMFENEMKEKLENTVEITDIKYDVLMEMLRFVYVGKVNNIDILADELAIAADKYALYELKSKCEKTMMVNLTVGNVIQCLQLANSIQMNKLKENAIDFIVDNATDVTEKPQFASLSSDLFVKICQSLEKKVMLI